MVDRLYIEKPGALRELSATSHGIIAASAGTGKTYTLEHLVVDLLLSDEEVKIQEILLVTFTVAATSDLRRKIRQKLERCVEAWDQARFSGWTAAVLDKDGDVLETSDVTDRDRYWVVEAEGARRLRSSLRHFDRAAIYTIHGFCQRVLREHAFSSRRLFDQEHVSETDVIQEAFAELLREEILPGSDEEWWFKEVLSGGKSISDIQDLLTGFVRCTGKFMPSRVDVRAFPNYLNSLLAALRDPAVETLEDEAAKIVKKLRKKYAPKVDPARHMEALVTLREVLGGESVVLWEPAAARALKRHPVGAVLKSLPHYDVTSEQVLTWMLGPRLKRRMTALKEREGYVTFDDMVRLVGEALISEDTGPALLSSLGSQYRVALIDEFQDTDVHQWRIFSEVFAESTGGHRLFLIGDPKQAIYGFRGGDVFTYLDARAELERRGALKAELRQNFRSTAPVIDAYNALFTALRQPEVDLGEGIEYPAEGVEVGRPNLELLCDGEPVEHGATLFEITTDIKKPSLDSVRYALARAYAKEIASIIRSGRYTYRKGKDHPEEPVGAENIYVLCRRRRDLDLMADALRKVGVPFAFMKKEGLFQTREAYDIYDLLLALDDPYDRSRRARVWMSPFFDLTLSDLEGISNLDELDGIFQKLLDWSRLAARREFGALFSTVVEESGLIRRRLLLERGERELTNYLHLMEILVEETARRAYTTQELAQRMHAFIEGRATPGGDETDQQRLETEDRAVQLLTIHGSKGLERGFVFVVPRFSSPMYSANRGPKRFHVDSRGTRQLVEWHGSTSELPAKYKERFEEELFAEERRLAYVALTRAQLQFYLPFGEKGSSIYGKFASGAFSGILERAGKLRRDPAWRARFRTVQVPLYARAPRRTDEAMRQDLRRSLEPLVPLLDEEPPRVATVEERRRLMQRRWEITSYSKLKTRGTSVDLDEERGDVAAPSPGTLDELVLPGGMATGNFLHLVMEELDYSVVADGREALETPEVIELFEACAARYGAFDDDGLAMARQHVFDTLTAPVTLPDGGQIQGLWRLDMDRTRREREFLFPVSEGGRRRFGSSAQIQGGFVTGIVDLLFEWGSKIYFADWKSDLAPPYDASTLARHVEDRYAEQAILYSLAVCRMLGIEDRDAYETHFGGYLYFFLRGMSPDEPGRGVYTGRVPWEDLMAFDGGLSAVIAEGKARRVDDAEVVR